MRRDDTGGSCTLWTPPRQFNPHAVILGGYLGVLAPHLMPGVEGKLATRIANLPFSSTRIVALPDLLPRVVGGALLAASDAVLDEPMRLTRAVA